MFSFQKVLFPVDFSARCQTMLPYVADLANRFGAQLHFFHVVEDGKHPENLCSRRGAELARFASRMRGGMYCLQTVAYGRPAEAIANYADAYDIPIIAMPTRGYARPGCSVLGSVTEAVLRKASRAVWTESPNGRPYGRWSPVLCAVDLEQGSEQVLSYASALAEQFDANLIVLHAVPSSGEGSFWHRSHLPPALSESEATGKLQELVQDLNLSAEVVAEKGSVEEVVGRVTERVRAQLLVIGRKSPVRADEWVGMHICALVKRSSCPVVSYRRRPTSKVCFWTEWQQEGSEWEGGSCLAPALNR